jgi:hypothetical protein
MALETRRDKGSSSPLMMALLFVAGATALGLAVAYLVVPFEAGAAWNAVMARMWF